ncbi:g2974 [Coccomyxa elongata]
MGKKAVKPKQFSRRKEAKPNLFEHIYNKKKFNVLGKKQKGEQKHGKARADAVDKRKKTLLVEYKELQKSNAFVDRRFGEDDSSLTEEEKALARFQRQRMKELTGTKFSLPDHDEEDELTHMGRALADDDIKAVGRPDLDDDDDGGLDDAIVRDFHFGGGFVPKKRVEGEEDPEAGEQEAPERRKSKKEVMEELIAKSKAFKAAKSQQRDEDLEATEALDTKLASLLESGSLAGLVKPKGARHNRKVAEKDAAPQHGDDTEFDRFRRELVFEAKGQVSERTKTAEELAELERQRLEALEARRQKRMRAGADEADDLDAEGDVAPSGGYKARRQKRQKRLQHADHGPSGDALEDEFQLSEEDEDEESGSEEEDEEPVSKLDARRKARAAGDDELQMQFKAESAALLEKYGIKPSEAGDGEGDSDEGGSGSEEDTEGTGADEESEESDKSELDDDDEDESDEAEADDGEQEGQEGAVGQALQQPDEDRERPSKRVDSGRAATTSEGAGDAAAGQLPFTLEAPSSYEEFAKLVNGRSAEELSLAIQRIRICSDALALASGNRKKMQVFYGILVQHFAMLAGSVPLPMDHLDALTVHLLDITGEVPFYAATVARARLSRLQQRLATALTNPEMYAGEDSAWPGTRALLLLKLWATLFPVSDRRHPVATPAALLVSAHLALCPISRASDIAQGLFLSALALHMAAPASRYVPEPLNFAVQLLQSVAPLRKNPPHQPQTFFSASDPSARWLALAPGGGNKESDAAEIQPLVTASVLAKAADDGYFASLEFKTSALAAAMGVVQRAAEVFGGIAALPEALGPAQLALEDLGRVKGFPKALEERRVEVLEAVRQVRTDASASRRPLVRRGATKNPEVKLFNPRFEEDFVAGKNYDPDRERAEQKKLKRQVQKEKRGAMRELRKDAVFLGAAREADAAAEKRERRKNLRANFAFLESQEADFKSGGQGGLWKKGGNKKARNK